MLYRRAESVSETPVDDDLFLVSPATHEIVHLDRLAAALWRLLAQPQSRAESPLFGIEGIVWISGLLILCYAPILYRLVNQWYTDEDMGHGFFVPAIAGYIAWQKRDELKSAPLKGNSLGLLLMAWGALQSIIGTLGVLVLASRRYRTSAKPSANVSTTSR